VAGHDPVTVDAFAHEIQTKGWVLFDGVVDDDALLDCLKRDLDAAYQQMRAIQIGKGMAELTDGAHHILGIGVSFVEFLDRQYLHSYIARYFGDGPYIINTFGGWTNRLNRHTYIESIHRDLRTFSGGYNLMINMLVMLDAFTLENGATYLLTGSHLSREKPAADVFIRQSQRAIGRRGSVVLFNSNLWHAAAPNTTDMPRAALTLTLSKPLVKPQFDYCRYFDDTRIQGLSDHVRQLIGYYSRVPASHDEWYQVEEANRFYRKDQG
jgi:hypothetical protein